MKILLLTAALAVFAQKEILQVQGTVENIFVSRKAGMAVIVKNEGKVTAHLFSPKLEPIKTVAFPDSATALPNEKFGLYLAFADGMAAAKEANPYQRISLNFLDLKSGAAMKSKLSILPESKGKWVANGEHYCIKGQLTTPEAGKVTLERVSGTPAGEVSGDLKWAAHAAIPEGVQGGKAKVSFEFENRANNDMVPVGVYELNMDGADLCEFTADSRYFYYRAGENPAIFDMKQRRSVVADNISYKMPQYFGYFLEEELHFFFHDYFSVSVVNKKEFMVESVAANPFAPEAMEILSVKGKYFFGALFQDKNGTRDYVKLFKMNWKNPEDYATVPLPVNIRRVWVEGETGHYLTLDGGVLKYNKTEIQ